MEKKTNKSKTTKAKSKPATPKPVKNKMVTQALTAPGEIEKKAAKIALELATREQLTQTEELTELESEAADMLGQGIIKNDVANILGVTLELIDIWHKKPMFLRRLNAVTIEEEGMSDKNARIRAAKQRVKLLNDAYFAKVEDLKDLGITTLSKLIQEANAEIAKLVDEKEDNGTNLNDISILVVNHFKNSRGKDYEDIDQFLNDDDYKYPTIDVQAE